VSKSQSTPNYRVRFTRRWQVILVVASLLFGAYILVFDRLAYRAAEKRVAVHARVISAALWHYNLEQSAEYLSLACASEHYQTLQILDSRGTTVFNLTSPPPNGLEQFLHYLRLIPRVPLTAPVHYADQFIGTVKVQWACRSFYQHLYLFFALLLALAVAYLYAGVAGAKRNLSQRVTARTAELAASNESLQSQIRERQRAEGALQQSYDTFRTILDSIDATIYVADMETYEILFMNQNMKKAYGGDKMGQICWEAFRCRTSPCINCTNDKLLKADGTPAETLIWEGQNSLNKKWYLNYDRAVSWVDGRTVRLQISTDITSNKTLEEKRQQAEQQLQQAQKLEAIGTLAGGIAHDFNNLMMGMMGNVNLVMYELDQDHPHYKKLERIEQQIESGAKLTRQLLGYARKGTYEIRPIDINTLLQECAETFGRTRKQIRIHRNLDKHLWGTRADWTQVEQVLLNLFINASDAMPDGGDLHLSTSNCKHTQITGRPFRPKPGSYVAVKVTDTGVGMPPEIRERIFDPFFTTKEMGRGTGLGLASAYGIIKGHGGYIDVTSTLGKGTAFTLYLPAVDAVDQKRAAAKKHYIHHGEGTILLVDDEEVVLNVAHQMLDKLGYTVLPARSGGDGLQLFAQHQGRIDLVILDMVMPDMNGGDVFDKIQEIRPGVPILLASGYSLEGPAEEIMERGCRGFIQKPYGITTLGETVKDILNNPEGLPN
jgi:C4-dicarboxylate-specific signal transduction histidine kinase/ActR/RegA family two-component response regulator